MDIGEFEKRMDDALGEVKHLLVQSGYYDNQTLGNIDCIGSLHSIIVIGEIKDSHYIPVAK